MDKRVLSSTTSLYPFIPVPDISPSYVSKSNGDIRNNNLTAQSNLPFDPKNFENTNNTTTLKVKTVPKERKSASNLGKHKLFLRGELPGF